MNRPADRSGTLPIALARFGPQIIMISRFLGSAAVNGHGGGLRNHAE